MTLVNLRLWVVLPLLAACGLDPQADSACERAAEVRQQAAKSACDSYTHCSLCVCYETRNAGDCEDAGVDPESLQCNDQTAVQSEDCVANEERCRTRVSASIARKCGAASR